jgi:hypothetical protein
MQDLEYFVLYEKKINFNDSCVLIISNLEKPVDNFSKLELHIRKKYVKLKGTEKHP